MAPVLLAALVWRVIRRRETLKDLWQRLGGEKTAVTGPVLWLHGASNGELIAARSFIEGMLSTQKAT